MFYRVFLVLSHRGCAVTCASAGQRKCPTLIQGSVARNVALPGKTSRCGHPPATKLRVCRGLCPIPRFWSSTRSSGGQWGSWHQPERVSTHPSQLSLRQCGKCPVHGEMCWAAHTRLRGGESSWGAEEDDGGRFSGSRDGAAARQERVTEQHSGGHFPSTAFSRNNTLSQTLWRLLWPCTGPSLLMFNPWTGTAASRRCQPVGRAVGGWAHMRSCPCTVRPPRPRVSCAAPKPQDSEGSGFVREKFTWKRG